MSTKITRINQIAKEKPDDEIIETIKLKLIGHFNYYGITDNFHSIRKFRWIVLGYLSRFWIL